jgi:transcriptional regulator with XRE-family HTH domain
MYAKSVEKTKAIKLRKQGLSYSEIIKKIDVSRSTLSLWLRDISLSNNARLSLEEKIANAQRLGAEAKRNQRLLKVKQIEKRAVKN